MLRRFIPKGKSMVNYSQEDIDYFADIINGLPRRILGYKTPDELFDRELDLIYWLFFKFCVKSKNGIRAKFIKWVSGLVPPPIIA